MPFNQSYLQCSYIVNLPISFCLKQDTESGTVKGNMDKTKPIPDAKRNYPHNYTTMQMGKKALRRVHERSEFRVDLHGLLLTTSKEKCVSVQIILQKEYKIGSTSLKMEALSQ